VNTALLEANSPELLAFIAGVTAVKEAYRVRNALTVYSYLTVEVAAVGPKFIKLQSVEFFAPRAGEVLGHAQKSGVYAFIDRKTGDVFMAATYKAPAKGARGNLFDAAGGLGRVTPHGLEYNN
jgi:hypothetical protein